MQAKGGSVEIAVALGKPVLRSSRSSRMADFAPFIISGIDAEMKKREQDA